MNTRAMVSIGVPVYNGARCLRAALSSLLSQDYPHFELIICDNASTDQTPSICEEFRSKDERVSYFRNESKVEVFDNFHLVLNKARGEYFMWAAADDTWLPTFVSALAAELDSHPDASVAMCATKRIRENGQLSDYVRFTDLLHEGYKKQFALALALASGQPHHLYFYGLFRRQFIRRAYCRIPMVVLGDRLFVCELALATRFRYVDEVLYIRRGHEESIGDRYPGEQLGYAWKDPMNYVKLVAVVGPYLMTSKVIPWPRKFLIPAIVLRFAWMQSRRVRRALWRKMRLKSMKFGQPDDVPEMGRKSWIHKFDLREDA